MFGVDLAAFSMRVANYTDKRHIRLNIVIETLQKKQYLNVRFGIIRLQISLKLYPQIDKNLG